MNRGASASREIETTTLPIRPIRVAHSHEHGNNSENGSLQSGQIAAQYPYGDYWRSPQHFGTVQATSTGCHGFVNGNLGNVGFPTYHQADVHPGLEASSVNGLNALRLRSHPYGSAYSAMHASM